MTATKSVAWLRQTQFLVTVILSALSLPTFKSFYYAHFPHFQGRASKMEISNSRLSTGEIEALVIERAKLRLERNYNAADSIKEKLNLQYNIEITDLPYKAGGHSTWRYVESHFSENESKSEVTVNEVELQESLMWLAGSAYELISSKERSEESVVDSSISILHHTAFFASRESGPAKIKEMQGRKFADAAFKFSLAGISSNDLYEMLLKGASSEIKRYGQRNSCRPTDILQVVERLAVAGILNQDLYQHASKVLLYKTERRTLAKSLQYEAAITMLSSGEFSIFSDMPLLWLWRFAARQRKHGNQMTEASDFPLSDLTITKLGGSNSKLCDIQQEGNETSLTSQYNAEERLQLPLFDDPTLPLVIEIGCGFGVSMLGLSYRENLMNSSASISRKHNFLACDMSNIAIGYARGISKRWGMDGYCQFLEADAMSFLQLIQKDYLGSVECILINFPTPYQFGAEIKTDDASKNNVTSVSGIGQKTKGERGVGKESVTDKLPGNAQLPNDLRDFMVTHNIIDLCKQILQKNDSSGSRFIQVKDNLDNNDMNHGENYDKSINDILQREFRKYLLIQTNVEDVAITLKNMVISNSSIGLGKFTIPVAAIEIQNLMDSWYTDYSGIIKIDDGYYRNRQLEINDIFMIDPPLINDLFSLLSVEELERSVSSASPLTSVIEIKENQNLLQNNDENINDNLLLQKRRDKWINSGGEMACGHGWLKSSPLPPQARTETEAMCEHEGKPVHRILFFFNP
jgi:hypothetical protein